MTYKEFIAWCNERACDGCWDMETAIHCLNIITVMKSVPFWRRKKLWIAIKNDIEIDVYSTNEKFRSERMTTKEALYWCEHFTDNIVLANPKKEKMFLALQAMKKCKEALEKQMPRKPDYEADGYADGVLAYDYAKCPVCEHEFEYGINEWGSAFCQDCGQALDWSDEE